MIIDPIEDRLGISTYLLHRKSVASGDGTITTTGTTVTSTTTTSTTTTTSNDVDGFTAISKARFSDFIVHEGKQYIFFYFIFQLMWHSWQSGKI